MHTPTAGGADGARPSAPAPVREAIEHDGVRRAVGQIRQQDDGVPSVPSLEAIGRQRPGDRERSRDEMARHACLPHAISGCASFALCSLNSVGAAAPVPRQHGNALGTER